MKFEQLNLHRETKFKDAVLAAAESQGMDIIAAAQQDASLKIAQAESETKAVAQGHLKVDTVLDGERQYSEARQNARKALLAHRTKLVKDIFDEAEERLQAFRQSDEYEPWLYTRLKECAAKSEEASGAVIYVQQQDMKFARQLEKMLPNAKVEKDDTIKLGGLRLRAGRMLYDMSLDNALQNEKEAFALESKLFIE